MGGNSTFSHHLVIFPGEPIFSMYLPKDFDFMIRSMGKTLGINIPR